MPILELEHVTKTFHGRRHRLLLGRGGLADFFRGKKSSTVHALNDISFTVEPGESFGIIGANGSGKSTLLKIIAGVTTPTTGSVRVYGRVASLLELGAGFHPMLTGRENIFLNAGLLGVAHRDVERVFDDIVAFSGIGHFIDNPVDTYSSGMFVRLGFSVAVHTNPDIFLVDEVLAVGDEEFQRRCRTRIGELKEQGKTILFVSHDLGLVHALCNRVILLYKGTLVTRRSPQETIEYYLRQVGLDKGVHTLERGPLEFIVNNGRLAMFHKKDEVSAPPGFYVNIQSMYQWHCSVNAFWQIAEATPTTCVTQGRMARLPVTLCWSFSIEEDALVWRLDIECERDTRMDLFEASLYFPAQFTRWNYDDFSGSFPEILPGDVEATTVVAPDIACREAAALPGEHSPLPPVITYLPEAQRFVRMQWANTDYITGCRVLLIGGRIPDSDNPVRAGRHHMMTIRLESGSAAERVHAKRRTVSRSIVAGDLTILFDHGTLRLFKAGEELTKFLNVYCSILAGDLWNNSQCMQWIALERQGDGLEATGESRRFAFRQIWRLDPAPNGCRLRIELEAIESIDIQEYHVSAVLRPDYERWETANESGAFPPFDPEQTDWRHLNRHYAPGGSIVALSASLPSVRIAGTAPDLPFRMTALNTGYHQNARVVQALRTPERGVFHFEQGRHSFFDGVLTVESTGRDV